MFFKGTGFQLAAWSMVTSSKSEFCRVLRMAQMYWSISSPSNSAVLLQNVHHHHYHNHNVNNNSCINNSNNNNNNNNNNNSNNNNLKGALCDLLLSSYMCPKLSPTCTVKWQGCSHVQIMSNIFRHGTGEK